MLRVMDKVGRAVMQKFKVLTSSSRIQECVQVIVDVKEYMDGCYGSYSHGASGSRGTREPVGAQEAQSQGGGNGFLTSALLSVSCQAAPLKNAFFLLKKRLFRGAQACGHADARRGRAEQSHGRAAQREGVGLLALRLPRALPCDAPVRPAHYLSCTSRPRTLLHAGGARAVMLGAIRDNPRHYGKSARMVLQYNNTIYQAIVALTSHDGYHFALTDHLNLPLIPPSPRGIKRFSKDRYRKNSLLVTRK